MTAVFDLYIYDSSSPRVKSRRIAWQIFIEQITSAACCGWGSFFSNTFFFKADFLLPFESSWQQNSQLGIAFYSSYHIKGTFILQLLSKEILNVEEAILQIAW